VIEMMMVMMMVTMRPILPRRRKNAMPRGRGRGAGRVRRVRRMASSLLMQTKLKRGEISDSCT